MPARKRTAEEKKNRNNDWTRMLAEVGVRQRLLIECPGVVLSFDHMVKVRKEYDGKSWTVFSDWLLDARVRCSRKWPPDLPFPDLNSVSESVFPILATNAT